MESPRLAGLPIAFTKESSMGQAAIDLPDPLQNQSTAGGPSADDLLAQLAVEEVDRLLAEAEVERPLWPQEARPASPLSAPHQQDSHFEQNTTSINPTPKVAAPSAGDPHTAAEAMLDSQTH